MSITNFIEVHHDGNKMLINLDWMDTITQKEINGEIRTVVFQAMNNDCYIIADESYEALKSAVEARQG